jgi:hypothetical protein
MTRPRWRGPLAAVTLAIVLALTRLTLDASTNALVTDALLAIVLVAGIVVAFAPARRRAAYAALLAGAVLLLVPRPADPLIGVALPDWLAPLAFLWAFYEVAPVASSSPPRVEAERRRAPWRAVATLVARVGPPVLVLFAASAFVLLPGHVARAWELQHAFGPLLAGLVVAAFFVALALAQRVREEPAEGSELSAVADASATRREPS